MTRDEISPVARRLSIETRECAEMRGRAPRSHANSTRANLAAATVVVTTLLAIGCTEEIESGPEPTSESAAQIHSVQPKPPSDEPPLDGPEFRLQRKRDWWAHAREMLFSDIELTAEQAQAVDAIIGAQLDRRALMQQLDAELKSARDAQDPKRISAAREEFRAVKAQLKKSHEIYEELRAVLAEEQRPAFDMNRARHVAAMQGSGRKRPAAGAEQTEEE